MTPENSKTLISQKWLVNAEYLKLIKIIFISDLLVPPLEEDGPYFCQRVALETTSLIAE